MVDMWNGMEIDVLMSILQHAAVLRKTVTDRMTLALSQLPSWAQFPVYLD